MTHALSTHNLTVAFGGLKALNDISLTFEEKKITGLIGPNGSGKSTLVNTLSGQIKLFCADSRALTRFRVSPPS